MTRDFNSGETFPRGTDKRPADNEHPLNGPHPTDLEI